MHSGCRNYDAASSGIGRQDQQGETLMSVVTGKRAAFAAAALMAAALGGCDTVGRTQTSSPGVAVLEEDKTGTSKVNIESLSDVIQRNPSDASAYNTRGAAY